METADKILQKADSFLSIAKSEIEEKLNNRQICQWVNVNLDLYENILPHLSLPKELPRAKKNYKNKAQELLSLIEKWQNEIGNLETNLKHNGVSPDQSLQLAKGIEKGANDLGSGIIEFRTFIDSIIKADNQIRSMLNLEAMLGFTQNIMSEKPHHFTQGYQIYCLLGDDENPQGSPERLSDIFTMAMAIDEKLHNIDFSGLPKMAADILDFHIASSHITIDAIKQFVENATGRITHIKNEIDCHKEQFEVLDKAPADLILKSMEPAAADLEKNIIKLRAHHEILEKTQLCRVLFTNLNLFYSTIQNSFIDALDQNIQNRQSPLNPYSLAHKNATDYFMGISGMIRSFKLIFKNLTGNYRLNEAELTLKLEDAINSCTGYLGKNESDIIKMEAFINGHLSGFSSPFPFDGLFQLMRNTLGEYGTRLEKYFNSFPISYNPDGTGRKSGSTTLGKLFTKTEIRRESLTDVT